MAKEGKLLYHLTALDNLDSILVSGLQSRAALAGVSFTDSADSDILDSRHQHGLEQHVPFHFFARNPFDYGVQRTNPEKDYVLLTVRRTVARANGWKIVPRHPLAEEGYQILDYDDGMEAIDWDLMDRRDYDDRACKVVCMAECLAPSPVQVAKFTSIYVKSPTIQKEVQKMVSAQRLGCHVNLAPHMFVGGSGVRL